MKNSYLEKVEELIKNKSAKKQILSELEAHIEDKTDYYADIGYGREEAEQKALEEMGDPEQAAVSLNALHNVKWYKNVFNIIMIASLIAIIPFGYSIREVFSYGDVAHDINHSLIKDIVSLVIFAVIALLIVLSYKRKNVFMAFFVTVFCSNLAVFFEPLYFPIVTLFTKGPVGLVDSVLTPTAVPYEIRKIYILLSYITVFFFIAWSLLVSIKIWKIQRCKPSKPFDKSHKVFRIITVCTALTMSAIMVISTVFACFRIPEYVSKRRDMIDFVVDYKKTDTNDDVLKRAESYGINLEHVGNVDVLADYYKVYAYYSGNSGVNYFPDLHNDEIEDDYYDESEDETDESLEESSSNILSCYVDLSNPIKPVAEDDIEVTYDAFDSLKLHKTTLEDFKQDGDYYNARSVTAYTSGKIQFYYAVKGSNYPWVLEFENGVLTFNESMDYAFHDFEEDPETTLPEPESINPLL